MVTKMTKKIIIISTLTAFVLTLGLVMGKIREKDDVLSSIDLFGEILYHVKTRYVEPVDNTKLFNGALNGLAESLDPESFYLPPEDYKAFKEEGNKLPADQVGLSLIKLNQYLRVIAVEPGSPADKAGILSGDFLTHISGKASFEFSLFQSRKMLSGKPGTSIEISVLDSSTGSENKHKLKRTKIVHAEPEKDTFSKDILYVDMFHFFKADFDSLKRNIKESTAEIILIDLRNNYLGDFDTFKLALSSFIDEPSSVHMLLGKDTKHTYEVKPSEKMPEKQIYLLVSQSTTHFAELFAASLQELGKAKVIGRPTNGLVGNQSVIPLERNDAIYITTEIYLTPGEKNIYTKGVKPDIEIKIDRDIKKEYGVKSDNGVIKRKDVLLHESLEQLKKDI